MDERVAVKPTAWLPLPDVAERLELSISKVRQLVRERSLLAVRRDGVLQVPEDLIADPTVRKHLSGVLTVLRDAGYNEEESLGWLFSPDESLSGGCPARALAGPEATEVRRRAQALGF